MNVNETPEKSAATKPLVVVSSRTGNTRTVAYAVRDALPGAELVAAEAMPESLSQYDPVILGFWCDCGRAPADMKRAAAKLAGKRVACFATLGGEPDTPRANQLAEACRSRPNATPAPSRSVFRRARSA